MTSKRNQRKRSPPRNSPARARSVSTPASNACDKESTAVCHMDLLAPLLQYYAAAEPTASQPQPGLSNQHSSDSDDNGELPLAPPHHRLEVLRSFVFSVSVTEYLRRVPLPVGAAAAAVKRPRTGPEPNMDSLDGVMAAIRAAADARLPAFADDSEFLAAHEARYLWNDWANHSSNFLNNSGQLLRAVKSVRLDVYQQCLPCQAAARDLFSEHIALRLQRMRLSPRVLRVAVKLRLEPHEAQSLIYVLICNCGASWPMNYHGTLSPSAVAYHNNLSSTQLMHFIAEYREHVRQGIICTDLKFKANFSESRLAMTQEVIAAFSGDSLSEEQLIKLEKTALADVLLAERASRAHGEEEEKCERVPRNGGSPLHRAHNDEIITSKGASVSRGGGESLEGSMNSAHVEEVLDSLDIDPMLLQSGDEAAIEKALTDRLGMILSAPTATRAHHREEKSVPAPVTSGGSSAIYGPYANDIEYMDESFKLLANVIRLRGAESDMKDEDELVYTPKNKVEATLRELKGKVRVATAIHRARVAATLQEGRFLPRIEALSEKLKLSDLEKQIMLLLVGNGVSHDVLIAINGRYVMREGQRVLTVGYILFVLCDTLMERVAARKAFYQSSSLLSNTIISLSLDSNGRNCFNTDLMDYVVDIDRKIVDYLMGTETETAEMVPGSRLYMPTIPMQNVVLPQSTTDHILSTIQHYSMFEECKRGCGFAEGLGNSSSGLVFLFYGPSGTGKTMLANAVAHELGRRILLVNLLQFKSDQKAPEMLRFVFREARLSDAIIFFDECEGFFESRESNPLVTSILSEFEKCESLVILATNKAQVIDEAMNRRISVMIEFKLPDPQMRERIWTAHIPMNLSLHEDVSIMSLAMNYELSGGLIRNATLAALSRAVAREKTPTPTLCMQDFEEGARLQLRGFFLASEKPPGVTTESYHRPKHSLSDLVLDRQTKQHLDSIARFAKGRSTLFSQWGFEEEDGSVQSSLYLFYGPSGTGKSLAAEAIAYECGATIRMCNVAELMLVEGVKLNNVFEEGRKLGAVIVFDEAQVLFNHTESSLHVAKLIHYHAVHYPRPVILIATTGGTETGAAGIDSRSTPLEFQQEVSFRMPAQAQRKELWERAIPSKMPLADDINFEELSREEVSAKLVRAAAFGACCRVAMLPVKSRLLTMQILREELEALVLKERSRRPRSAMFA